MVLQNVIRQAIIIRQYFYRMKKEANKIKQPHYSPIKFIKEAQKTLRPIHPSPLFVPFAQQRDSLGRLIKPQKEEESQKQIMKKISQDSYDKLNKNFTSQTCVSLSDKVNIIQDTIINSFQYKNPCPFKLYQSNKIPIHKKVSVQIPSIKSNRKYSGEDLLMESPGIETQSRRPRFLSSDLTLQVKQDQNALLRYESLPKLKISNSNIATQERSRRQTLGQKEDEKMKKKQSLTNSSSKLDKKDPVTKQFSEMPKQRIQLQLLKKKDNQMPVNLQSYRRWPKLNNEIEKANEIFFAKIRQSKKLAYKIKLTLESEQWSQN